MKVRINITNEDGEVLDIFHIDVPCETDGALSNEVREFLGRRFDIPEDAEEVRDRCTCHNLTADQCPNWNAR